MDVCPETPRTTGSGTDEFHAARTVGDSSLEGPSQGRRKSSHQPGVLVRTKLWTRKGYKRRSEGGRRKRRTSAIGLLLYWLASFAVVLSSPFRDGRLGFEVSFLCP